jgi:adenosylmethionine-8-amino-7-oxononanoate aminotransferase
VKKKLRVMFFFIFLGISCNVFSMHKKEIASAFVRRKIVGIEQDFKGTIETCQQSKGSRLVRNSGDIVAICHGQERKVIFCDSGSEARSVSFKTVLKVLNEKEETSAQKKIRQKKSFLGCYSLSKKNG